MAIAKRKIGPVKPARSPIDEYVEELEFEVALAYLYEEREIPAAAAAALRNRVTESPDDEAL